MSAENGLDLSVLYRQSNTSNLTAPSCLISRSAQPGYFPAALHWSRGHIKLSLYRRDIDQISLMRLGLRCRGRNCQPSAFGDFCLSAKCPCKAPRIHQRSSPQINGLVPAILPWSRTAIIVRTLWQAGCEQLIVKIPYSLFDSMGHQSFGTRVVTRGCVYKLAPCMRPQWANLIQHLLLLQARNSNRPTSWTQHIESNVACFCCVIQPMNRPCKR